MESSPIRYIRIPHDPNLKPSIWHDDLDCSWLQGVKGEGSIKVVRDAELLALGIDPGPKGWCFHCWEKKLTARIYELEPKFKRPKVKLTDRSGNVFDILGRVRQALQKKGYHRVADLYFEEATRTTYDHLLVVSMLFAEVS